MNARWQSIGHFSADTKKEARQAQTVTGLLALWERWRGLFQPRRRPKRLGVRLFPKKKPRRGSLVGASSLHDEETTQGVGRRYLYLIRAQRRI
jgi:hypothetical protein